MPYDNVISRTDAAALIPEQVASEVIGRVTEQSAALTTFRRIPVSRAQLRIPIIAALPTAYWVNGDTGTKQTTEVNWANKYLNIEELACIVPIPEAVLDDTDFDVWGEVRPLLEEAIGRSFDSAVFFGTNAPASFPTNIYTAAVNAGNAVTEGSTAANGGFLDDVDLVIAAVEADGFDPNTIVAARTAKGKFRGARATTGERLGGLNGNLTEYDGINISYPMRGLFPSGLAAPNNVRLFAGDTSEFVVGVRRDLTYKILDQAVITDNSNPPQIIYNLPQQDMVAMRVTFRAGWQVSNAINYDQATEANRYPVGVLRF